MTRPAIAPDPTAPVASYFGTFEEFEETLADADYATWTSDQWDLVEDLYDRLDAYGRDIQITEAEYHALRRIVERIG